MKCRVISVAVIRHSDGEYIFQRRDNRAKNSPGMLGLFGGHVENEEPKTALLRELKEECSLIVKISDLKFVSMKILEELVVFYYLLNIDTKKFEVYEGVGLEIYSKEEIIKRKDVAFSAKEIFYDNYL